MSSCDRVIDRPKMTILFLLFAVVNSATTGREPDLELQEKFDLGWAKEQLNRAKQQAGHAYSKAIEASKDATNLTSGVLAKLKDKAANVTSQVSNITERVSTKLGRKAKREAFWAVLMYLGKCPDYYSYIPRVPAAVAPFMARAFQESEEDPSSSHEACMAAAVVGVHQAIDDYSKDQTQQKEKVAMKWITADRAKVLCNKDLMTALRIYRPIRKSYAPQYKAGLIDRIILRVVTEDLLTNELDNICGGQRTTGLFEKHGTGNKVLPTASAPSPRLLPLLTLVTCVTVTGLVAAVSLVARRLGRSAMWQEVLTSEQHALVRVQE